LQKALESHIRDMNVGINSNIKTEIPEMIGVATRVVEKVASNMKKKSLSQSFFNHEGHVRERP
jgi:hypothetical protein